jgi:hypothetical protein
MVQIKAGPASGARMNDAEQLDGSPTQPVSDDEGVPETTSSLDPARRPARPMRGCATKLLMARSILSTIARAAAALSSAMKS